MMTREKPLQSGLFEPKDLGARVPADHLLRRINETLDLSFVYDLVERTYGAVGQESLPPPTVLKLMLLLTLYKVESERELFRALPMRIDWLWFLGYDLSSKIPNHSVLSKARRRWGTKVFDELFIRTIQACIDAGLVHGREFLADSSLVDANASVDSLFVARAVTKSTTSRLNESGDEAAEEEPDQDESEQEESSGSREPKYRSATDPDATGAKRRGEMRARPRYQTHRGVDAAHGVITATAVGPGHENEAHRLEELLVQHTEHTGLRIEAVTADSKYGTADNLELCEFNGIKAFINPLRNTQVRPKEGHFTDCCFHYDESRDIYTCPAGQTLVRTQYRPDKDSYRYMAPAAACRSCPARALCRTSKANASKPSKTGRSVSRQVRQPILDRATARVRTAEGKQHLNLRKWMMEGSFARSVRFGYKRARGRGLCNMIIQDYLVAAVQNLMILLWSKRPKTPNAAKNRLNRLVKHVIGLFQPITLRLAAISPWPCTAHDAA